MFFFTFASIASCSNRDDSCSFRCDSMKLLAGEGGPMGIFMSDIETSKSARSLLTESFASMLVLANDAFLATSFESVDSFTNSLDPTYIVLAFPGTSEELRGEAIDVLACLSAFN